MAVQTADCIYCGVRHSAMGPFYLMEVALLNATLYIIIG